MKKYIILILFLSGFGFFTSANPIDVAPKLEFSKLVFYTDNNWAMKIYFPLSFGDSSMGIIDSIVFSVSNLRSKLLISYPEGPYLGIVTSDSLSVPLLLNRDGDKIIIYTYSNGGTTVRQDSIIYGNYAGATVGTPINGYSILRIKTYLLQGSFQTIDCLVKNSSIDSVDSLSAIGCTMKGHIYDINNRIVKKYILDGSNPIEGKFIFETNLSIDSTGTFTTFMFNTLYKPWIIFVNVGDYQFASGEFRIKPLQLDTVIPGTIIYKDIYLTDTCTLCSTLTGINNLERPQNSDLTLINYPNPFNLSTNIYIKLPDKFKNKTGSINIYNVAGQLIRSIEYKNQPTVSWDAKDDNGKIMPSGIYYYRLSIDKQILKTGSMILLK